MKKIAVLTSGGDSPGMNAAIRAVVRSGLDQGLEVFGVRQGFAGLMAGDWRHLSARDVGGIMQIGGTVLGSARCLEFKEPEGRRRAVEQLRAEGIEGLVVIGGNGSQTGSLELSRLDFPVVGVASTIDNDLFGADVTLGVDTALNIALEAIDRLKNTGASHRRAILVEVMGRDCGYLALMAAIAGGAEAVLLPEREIAPEQLAEKISAAYDRGKSHALIVVAEGASMNATALVKHFQEHHERLGYGLRATILGHVQRGGNPGAFDRVLATRLGHASVKQLVAGNPGGLVGLVDGDIVSTPLEIVCSTAKSLDPELIALADVMSV